MRATCRECGEPCDEGRELVVYDCQVARGIGRTWREKSWEPTGLSDCCGAEMVEEVDPGGS